MQSRRRILICEWHALGAVDGHPDLPGRIEFLVDKLHIHALRQEQMAFDSSEIAINIDLFLIGFDPIDPSHPDHRTVTSGWRPDGADEVARPG